MYNELQDDGMRSKSESRFNIISTFHIAGRRVKMISHLISSGAVEWTIDLDVK